MRNQVRKTTNIENLPTIELLCGGTPLKDFESRNLLQTEIFDGIQLDVRMVMMSVLINIGRKTYTVNISPVRYINNMHQSIIIYLCCHLYTP